MNAEETCKMIDIITEGRPYVLTVKTAALSCDDMSIRINPESIYFFDVPADFMAMVDDPRVAREIAGALVAWADRKERSFGSNEPGNPHPGKFHGGKICPTCRKDKG